MKSAVAGVVIIGVSLALCWFFVLPDVVSGIASVGWPQAGARITAAEKLVTESLDDGPTYAVRIAYRYTVAGRSFASERIQFGRNSRAGEAEVDALLAEHPIGSTATAYYDPAAPEVAVLRPGVNSDVYVAVLLLLIGLGFGLLVLVAPFWQRAVFRNRMRDIAERSPVSPRGTGDGALTASEMVFMDGAHHAARRWRKSTTLLDGRTRVSQDLLVSVLKAALLAHESKGTITLDVADWREASGRRRPRLVVTPTGAAADWPPDTLESRLRIKRPQPVGDLVQDWLCHASGNPAARGLDKVRVLLTLRGLARLDYSLRDGLTYGWAETPDADGLAAATEPARLLLDACSSSRPEIDAELSAEIHKGFKSSRGDQDTKEIDVWLDEAADQRGLYADLFESVRSAGVGVFWNTVLAIMLLVPAVIVARDYGSPAPALIAGAVLLAYLLEWRLRSRERPVGMVIARVAIGGPALFLAIVFALAMFDGYPIATVLAVVVIAFLTSRAVLHDRVKAKIATEVSGRPALPADGGDAAATVPEPDVPPSFDASPATVAATSSAPASATHVDAPGGLAIKVLKPDDLAEGSTESRARLDAIRQRGPEIRRVYARALLFLCTGITAVQFLSWGLGWAPGAGGITFAEGKLWSIGEPAVPGYAFFGATVVGLLIVGLIVRVWLPRRHNQRRADDALTHAMEAKPLLGGAWRMDIMTIRPVVVPLLGAIWVYIGLAAIGTSARATPPWNRLLVALLVAIVVGYVVWVRRGRARVERAYPLFPSLNLLVLRVFGGTDLEDYMGLLDRWHWMGTMQMLDGPDNSGDGLFDFVRYLSGTTETSIVKTDEELAAALASFNERRDRQLRFGRNSIQCSDRTWQTALDQLLARSHVVVMDLSGFSHDNHGCAYELAALINKVPLGRFVLLVNDDTDQGYLQATLQEAWAGRAADSLNAAVESPEVQLFKIGGDKQRQPNETQLEFVQRLRARIDRERLVAMLCDAALSGGAGSDDEALRTPEPTRWGAPGLPRVVRQAGVAVAAMFLLYALLTSWMFLNAERGEPGEEPPAVSVNQSFVPAG